MKLDNEDYGTFNVTSKCTETLYSQYKEHCITKTCRIYKNGSKVGNTRSANIMVSDKLAE